MESIPCGPTEAIPSQNLPGTLPQPGAPNSTSNEFMKYMNAISGSAAKAQTGQDRQMDKDWILAGVRRRTIVETATVTAY